MRYVAVNFTSGGLTGHRFKDQTTAKIAAQLYDLKYVHTPFPHGTWPEHQWEDFLGFGDNEIKIEELDFSKINKTININKNAWFGLDLDFVTNIINRHPEDNTLFLFTESARIMLEQLPKSQRDLIVDDLRNKYWEKRKTSPITEYFDKSKINVALHIRRGDDVKEGALAAWRATELTYFEKIIKNINNSLVGPEIDFHIYSRGNIDEFDSLLKNNSNIYVHLNPFPPNYQKLFVSFHHMMIADIFVTSVSAFSYFIGYMNKNCIINYAKPCPPEIGCGSVVSFPLEERFIQSNAEGNFDENKLKLQIYK